MKHTMTKTNKVQNLSIAILGILLMSAFNADAMFRRATSSVVPRATAGSVAALAPATRGIFTAVVPTGNFNAYGKPKDFATAIHVSRSEMQRDSQTLQDVMNQLRNNGQVFVIDDRPGEAMFNPGDLELDSKEDFYRIKAGKLYANRDELLLNNGKLETKEMLPVVVSDLKESNLREDNRLYPLTIANTNHSFDFRRALGKEGEIPASMKSVDPFSIYPNHKRYLTTLKEVKKQDELDRKNARERRENIDMTAQSVAERLLGLNRDEAIIGKQEQIAKAARDTAEKAQRIKANEKLGSQIRSLFPDK